MWITCKWKHSLAYKSRPAEYEPRDESECRCLFMFRLLFVKTNIHVPFGQKHKQLFCCFWEGKKERFLLPMVEQDTPLTIFWARMMLLLCLSVGDLRWAKWIQNDIWLQGSGVFGSDRWGSAQLIRPLEQLSFSPYGSYMSGTVGISVCTSLNVVTVGVWKILMLQNTRTLWNNGERPALWDEVGVQTESCTGMVRWICFGKNSTISLSIDEAKMVLFGHDDHHCLWRLENERLYKSKETILNRQQAVTIIFIRFWSSISRHQSSGTDESF